MSIPVDQVPCHFGTVVFDCTSFNFNNGNDMTVSRLTILVKLFMKGSPNVCKYITLSRLTDWRSEGEVNTQWRTFCICIQRIKFWASMLQLLCIKNPPWVICGYPLTLCWIPPVRWLQSTWVICEYPLILCWIPPLRWPPGPLWLPALSYLNWSTTSIKQSTVAICMACVTHQTTSGDKDMIASTPKCPGSYCTCCSLQHIPPLAPNATTMRFIVSHHTSSPKSMLAGGRIMSLFIMTSWPLFIKKQI